MSIEKRLRDVIFSTLFENVSLLIFFKKFVKIVDEKNTIYALICFLTFNNDESIEMSIKIRKFQNVFSFKIATILFFITIKIMQSI